MAPTVAPPRSAASAAHAEADEEADQEADAPQPDDAAQQRRQQQRRLERRQQRLRRFAQQPACDELGFRLGLRLDQRALRAAAGGADHAGRARDQAHAGRADVGRDERGPHVRRPRPPTWPRSSRPRPTEATDDTETYDTYLSSSEPVATKTAPVWVVPGILIVLTGMLALLGGVLGRGNRPALARVKATDEPPSDDES